MLRCMLMFLIIGNPLLLTQEPPAEKPEATEQAAPESQPTTAPERVMPRSPEQAQILQELLRGTERPHQPIVSREPQADEPGAAPRPTVRGGLLLEGEIITDVAGHLVRAGDRSEFHFKSGGPIEGAPSVMEFNKNGLLEAIEIEAENGIEDFIISAEITRYRGKNYLNLLRYQRQRTHGNLGP